MCLEKTLGTHPFWNRWAVKNLGYTNQTSGLIIELTQTAKGHYNIIRYIHEYPEVLVKNDQLQNHKSIFHMLRDVGGCKFMEWLNKLIL